MNFHRRKFSKRFAEIDCAVFVIHESPRGDDARYAHYFRGTAAAIILPDGHFWIGVTLCSPSDRFIKKVGRAKAIGRAYQLYRCRDSHGAILIDSQDSIKQIIECLQDKIDEKKRQMAAVGRMS